MPPCTHFFHAASSAFLSVFIASSTVAIVGSLPPSSGLNADRKVEKFATPGPNATDGHARYGGSRRTAIVPVVDGSMRVIDFACMFMLQPLTLPMSNVQLEFRGNTSAAGNPCQNSGLPGGTTGPLTPVLVQ